jgi:hypothetical protein
MAITLIAQGDFSGARRLQERLMEYARRVLGEEHPAALTLMSNLAGAILEQGDHAGAQQAFERVLEGRGTSGHARLDEQFDCHPQEAGGLCRGAAASGEGGGSAEAGAGPGTPSRADCDGQSGATTLAAQGDHAGARQLQERVVEVRKRCLGEGHHDNISNALPLMILLSVKRRQMRV